MRVETRVAFDIWPLVGAVGLVLIAFGAFAALVAVTRDAPELLSPTALAASPDGRLFCYDSYSRIVSLDSSGRLIRSWPVSAGAGVARLRATTDHLEVATVRTKKHFLYTFEGNLIESRANSAAFFAFPESHRAPLPGGAFAELRGESLVSVDPAGVQTVIVPSRPWPLAGWPLPSSILTVAAVPGTISVFLAWALRRQLHAAGRPTSR